MSALAALIARDLAREWRSGSWWLPVAFFLLVATLYPFAVGPQAELLARTGGGILWVAALLAALLPVERLFASDRDTGVLDQLAVRGIADESVAAARLISHTLGFGLPLLLATVPGAALLGLGAETWLRLVAGLAMGAPALAGLAVMIAAITLGSRSSNALGGLMMLPLAVPVLIFGAGALDDQGRGAMLFLGAASLLLVAVTPFAAGAALRAVREN